MSDPLSLTLLKIFTVFVLVFANGFFVAAEFALVGVRRSRVQELLRDGVPKAALLKRATDHLDAYLAATQLGITLSSLALGWIGEPAIAHLVEPLLKGLPFDWAGPASHMIAVIISFTIITALHIVLGELAPKSLALQRAEKTALATVFLLDIFLMIFRPAIQFLNGVGNLVLRLCGLQPGSGEEFLHSTEELKLLVAASQQAGLLHPQQQEVMEHVLSIGERRARDIMTHLPELVWIDIEKSEEEIRHIIRNSPHDQMIVSQHDIQDMLGIVRKQDMYNHIADGKPFNLRDVVIEPLIVYESMSIMKVLEFFKKMPVHMAVVVDEYGEIQGVLTQSDLLGAIAGDLFMSNIDEDPDTVEQEDGAILMDGMMSVYTVFDRLGLRNKLEETGDFQTLAGLALYQMEQIPEVGDSFILDGWEFTIHTLDERRIDKIMVKKIDQETSQDIGDAG